MIEVLILLAFAKIQEAVNAGKAWQWAAAYSVFSVLWNLLFNQMPWLHIALFALVVFVYVWGYFALLRRLSDSIALWLLAYIGGAFAPLLLAFI